MGRIGAWRGIIGQKQERPCRTLGSLHTPFSGSPCGCGIEKMTTKARFLLIYFYVMFRLFCLHVCLCVYTMRMPGGSRGQEKASDPLEQEL